jgi:hypothetical protein
VLFNKTLTINRGSTPEGTYTLVTQAKISLGSVLSSNYQSFSMDLTTIPKQNVGKVPSLTISAGYGNYVGLGDTVTLKWAKATGGAQETLQYDLEWSRGSSGWQTWKTVSASQLSITDSFTDPRIDYNGAGKEVKYRIRARANTIVGEWTVSNTLIISGSMDLKVNDAWKSGSTWINVNGTWRRAKRVWIKVNGTWQYSK